MDLYEAFNSVIDKNGIEILDDSSKCEESLKKQGFNGDDLNTKLFFNVLKQNIHRKMYKIIQQKKDYSNYSLSVKIFCDLFGAENMSNECENILIRHISMIISAFEARKLIKLDMQNSQSSKSRMSLPKAVVKVLNDYDISVLETPKRLRSILDDICEEEDNVLEFIEFLCRINNGTIDLDNQKEIDDIKKFARLLGNTDYPPLVMTLSKIKGASVNETKGDYISEKDRRVMICSNCGKEMEEDAVFCSKCGTKLVQSSHSEVQKKTACPDRAVLDSKIKDYETLFKWARTSKISEDAFKANFAGLDMLDSYLDFYKQLIKADENCGVQNFNDEIEGKILFVEKNYTDLNRACYYYGPSHCKKYRKRLNSIKKTWLKIRKV